MLRKFQYWAKNNFLIKQKSVLELREKLNIVIEKCEL